MSLNRNAHEIFPDVVWKQNVKVTEHPLWRGEALNPTTIELKKGHVRSEGHRPFPLDVLYHKDVTIELNDGLNLYADVFRPAISHSERVPGIITWGPFGKTNTG